MEAFLAGRSTEDPRPRWHDVQALAFEEKILPLLDAVESIIPNDTYLIQEALQNMSSWAKNGQERMAAILLPSAQVEAGCGDVSSSFLISKNVNMLESLLKEVVTLGDEEAPESPTSDFQSHFETPNETPYVEIQLAIQMKPVNRSLSTKVPFVVDLAPVVLAELREFVIQIAMGYEKHPFHNFQHASHVAHLSNILVHSMDGSKEGASGIVHDPFVRFAIVLSALVHDVDHSGVPNGRLAEEKPDMARKYSQKSIAEQNSIDVAWGILMSDAFVNLRNCLFGNSAAKQRRLRQLMVNSIMATDIFDQGLREFRELRWEKSSSCESCMSTLILEHILQASDVVHTMQDWEIYRQWNGCLFQEMYTAYLEGRADKDPSEGWYDGELWFFDNWVLPLARKLKESGVLNAVSDQLLEQANRNRSRWEVEGRQICISMLASLKKRPSLRDTTASSSTSSYSARSLFSDVSTSETMLTTTIVEEIESLTKVMKRYERKLDTACGTLVAVKCKGEADPIIAGLKEQSLPNKLQFFREKSWYNEICQKKSETFKLHYDEISAVTFGPIESLDEALINAEWIANDFEI
eukprot:scaffold1913_cov100-Cylindrotheca_fusiformis.AAC.1